MKSSIKKFRAIIISMLLVLLVVPAGYAAVNIDIGENIIIANYTALPLYVNIFTKLVQTIPLILSSKDSISGYRLTEEGFIHPHDNRSIDFEQFFFEDEKKMLEKIYPFIEFAEETGKFFGKVEMPSPQQELTNEEIKRRLENAEKNINHILVNHERVNGFAEGTDSPVEKHYMQALETLKIAGAATADIKPDVEAAYSKIDVLLTTLKELKTKADLDYKVLVLLPSLKLWPEQKKKELEGIQKKLKELFGSDWEKGAEAADAYSEAQKKFDEASKKADSTPTTDEKAYRKAQEAANEAKKELDKTEENYKQYQQQDKEVGSKILEELEKEKQSLGKSIEDCYALTRQEADKEPEAIKEEIVSKAGQAAAEAKAATDSAKAHLEAATNKASRNPIIENEIGRRKWAIESAKKESEYYEALKKLEESKQKTAQQHSTDYIKKILEECDALKKNEESISNDITNFGGNHGQLGRAERIKLSKKAAQLKDALKQAESLTTYDIVRYAKTAVKGLKLDLEDADKELAAALARGESYREDVSTWGCPEQGISCKTCWIDSTPFSSQMNIFTSNTIDRKLDAEQDIKEAEYLLGKLEKAYRSKANPKIIFSMGIILGDAVLAGDTNLQLSFGEDVNTHDNHIDAVVCCKAEETIG